MILDRKTLSAALPVLFVLLSVVLPREISAQSTDLEPADFSLVVRTGDDGIALTCLAGCGWETLSFSARVDGAPQAVDQNGMTTLESESIGEASDPVSFLFTIRRTADGVSLQGVKGSAWTSLAFSCPAGGCDQAVDRFGMAANTAR